MEKRFLGSHRQGQSSHRLAAQIDHGRRRKTHRRLDRIQILVRAVIRNPQLQQQRHLAIRSLLILANHQLSSDRFAAQRNLPPYHLDAAMLRETQCDQLAPSVSIPDPNAPDEALQSASLRCGTYDLPPAIQKESPSQVAKDQTDTALVD